MKLCKLLLSAFLFIITSNTFAAWQVSRPETTVPREPFFQAGAQQQPQPIPMPIAYSAPMPRAVPYRSTFLPTPIPAPTAFSGASLPNQYAHLGQPAPIYAVSISGSLKENLERIMGRYHWRVVWKAPVDYNFDGRVTGGSLPNVIEKLLKPFPLQAVMYMSNRTLTVTTRSA